ncbi:ABC transporter ATP-binding protein [Paenibacillus cymbidii]|uniref:ABC transporter ATP-binding protein n=1 Tax=Paenibacillus cymbidii TaxID=1639034 RepID=UPI001F375F3E|nr:ABC transporter ATP-binding protein [Paenibacillus cymbidii]
MRGLSDKNEARATFKDVKLGRVFRLFRPYWRRLAVILVLALTTTLIGLVPPLLMKEIVDTAIPGADKTMLVTLALLMIALPAASGLIGIWQNHLNNQVGQSVMRDLRYTLFHNLQRQSIAFFTSTRTGDVIQRLVGDVQAVQSAVTGTVVQAITQAITVLGTAAILFRLDWRLALLALTIVPLFLIPVRKVSALRKTLRLDAQKARGDMSSQLTESFGVSGAMLTRIFTQETSQERQFRQLNDRVMGLELRLALIGRWYGTALALLVPFGTAIIYLYGGWNVISGAMSLGSIIAFVSYIRRLYEPTQSLLNLHLELATALGIFQRIFEYMDLAPDIVDAPNARTLAGVRGRVEFRGVSFAYRPKRYALRDVSFTAEPGQTVALVGPSGAGKSTLISMTARLYDPTAGAVLLDGHDIRDVTLESLRSSIAVVTQESFLFHGTIAGNLRFARENATDAELIEACRKAYIHDAIAALPDGYDTVVGERGYRLSGGERQRLSIARAILRDPRVLILDEATSHLDSQSEAYVQAALEGLLGSRTTLVIAHRLSTVLAADNIVVLDQGRIVAQGTHAELLAAGGLYATLYETQFAAAAAASAEEPQARDERDRQPRRRGAGSGIHSAE